MALQRAASKDIKVASLAVPCGRIKEVVKQSFAAVDFTGA